jgi:superoxide dismutase
MPANIASEHVVAAAPVFGRARGRPNRRVARRRSGPQKRQRAIARDFGNLERWRAEFAATGKAEGGGSGWVILSYSPRDKRLVNQWAADQTTTLAGGRPVLVLDMYEHA